MKNGIIACLLATLFIVMMSMVYAEEEARQMTSLEFFKERRENLIKEMELQSNGTLGGPAGIYGVDLSQPCSVPGFQCLKNNGFRYAIVRCYLSIGKVDGNCPASLTHAWQGGMNHVDAYLFPCPHCGTTGRQQVIDMVNFIRHNNAKFGMIWFDVEGAQYWTTNPSTNRAFFLSMVEGAREAGVHAGVYVQKWFWEQIMGGNWDVSQYHMPVWYAHYDDRPSYYDWVPFGGWREPAMKQYHGTTNICGCGIDKNVY